MPAAGVDVRTRTGPGRHPAAPAGRVLAGWRQREGKSTVARRIAAEHGLARYATDDVMGDHARRLGREEAPSLAAFTDMTMDERWVDRSPEVMLDPFHWFLGEGFGLIVEDLRRLSARGPVPAEGFRLLPSLVAPLLVTPRRAVWLLPSPGFRRAAFTARGTLWDIARRTSDPERALARLLDRDALFTDRHRRETRALGLAAIEVGSSTGEGESSRQVVPGLGLDRGPEAPS